MPIQSPQSITTFQADVLAALGTTGISQTSPGGKARAFADIVGSEMGGLEGRSYAAIGQSLLPFATGDNLDFLGEMYGIPRLDGSTASSSSSDGNFIFYVQSGTFGDINSGSDITVPAGTVLSTGSVTGPTYTTDYVVTLPAALSSVSFSATCTLDGEVGNISEGAITNHNFQGYTSFRFGSLLVTNNFGIVSGDDEETDTDYQYRINLKLSSKNGAAEADLTLAILNVPGLQNVIFQRQAGTYLCYVYAVSPTVPTSTLQMVQAQMNTATAWPIVGTAVQPDLIGISLSTTITFVSGATSSQQQSAIANAVSAAAGYINNLSIGQTLVINDISDAILSSDPNILDIGQPNQPLTSIYIWRSRDDGTRYSRYLIADYTPAIGERIVVEPSITTPIVLTAA